MDQHQPLEFNLKVTVDLKTVRDVITGILHTIFFHRWFPEIEPKYRDVTDVTLPHVTDGALEAEIAESAKLLERQLLAERKALGGNGGGGETSLVMVQFMEKRRKRGWLGRSEDEICWEVWNIKVTVAESRTENDRLMARRAPGASLERVAFDIITKVNTHKDHIPPITTSGDGNPFPYKIVVADDPHAQARDMGAGAGWAARMGMTLPGYR